MRKLDLLYEGTGKCIYATDNPEVLLLRYKDEAIAFGGLKRSRIPGKGGVNNRITNHFMRMLECNGVATQYIEEISDEETLVRRADIIPLETVIRNVAAGTLCQRLGLREGDKLRKPVLEFHYKHSEMDDPLVNRYHITAMGWTDEPTLNKMAEIAFRVNQLLTNTLRPMDLELLDFRLEFGRTGDGTLVVADEISADSCRFWDAKTHEHLDKEVFRRDMGDAAACYQELLQRVLGDI